MTSDKHILTIVKNDILLTLKNLNLKPLMKNASQSIKHAIHMSKPGLHLTSLDIKDAFYSVPVCKVHRKFLKFMHKGKAFQFDVMPNGYEDVHAVV